jgi:hypothetical protein
VNGTGQRSGKHRRRWLLLGLGAGTACLTAGITGWMLYQGQKPPPLGNHAPNVYRLTIAGHGQHSVPPMPTAFVRLKDGTPVGLMLTGPADRDGPHQASVGVNVGNNGSTTHWFTVTDGDRFTAQGVHVTVLKVWRMPDWGNNAVDVQADPVR